MGYERRVKLFKNGRNKAIRIPRELEAEFPGDEAVIRKEGSKFVLAPAPHRESVAEMLDRWAFEGPITDEEWPEVNDPPPEPVEF